MVTVYDCVVDAGLPWIVMENGARDLEAVIRESGPAPVPRRSETDCWRTGFRYVECEVYRLDGTKLTSSIVTQPPSAATSAQPASG